MASSSALLFLSLFVFALALSVVVRLWLASRQMRHVWLHRDVVPPEFADRVALSAHQRAAAYTIARVRLGMIEMLTGAALLVALTLLGGLQWISELLVQWVPGSSFARQMLLVVLAMVISGLVDLPFSIYRQFRLEERFGFNRMTWALYGSDALKGLVVAAVLGLPLLAVVLWLMNQAGDTWWLWAWAVWVAFNLAVLVVYPTLIAPLFNKFEPLADDSVRQRVEALLERCGFASKGLFVMDGSRRSAHGNAYFTGLGRSKRIVFFDTLLSRLQPQEVEAVLAHELGHFRHRHILKRIVFSFLASLVGLALLGWLSTQTWFYQGLGMNPAITDRAGAALVLFFLAMPVFVFIAQPLFSLLSRRHEFEADAFAASHAGAKDLITALVKLYEDNAATLTPDPLHSAFYDSHPPAAQRIGRLLQLSRASGHVPASGHA